MKGRKRLIKNLKVKKKITNFKNEKIKKKEKTERGLKPIIFSLIISTLLFFVLIGLEVSILEKYEKTEVVIAKNNIESGTEITSVNKEILFGLKEVDVSLKTEASFVSLSDLEGYIVRGDIEKSEIVSGNNLIKKSSVLAVLNEPVEVAFKAEDISQVVGGILRTGDLIDISVVNSYTKQTEKIFSNVYVSKVFNSGGIEIDKVEKDNPSVVVNVLIDKETENIFNEKILSGIVRISRVGETNY